MGKQSAVAKNAATKWIIKGLIGGQTPLLFNPVTQDLLAQLRGRAAKVNVRDLSFDQEAEQKLLTSDHGHIQMPVVYILAALIEAGRSVAYSGRAKFSTKESSVIPAVITFNAGEFLPMLKADGTPLMSTVEQKDWATDIRRGRNPNGGELVCVVRPKLNEWYVPFQIEVNSEGLDAEVGEEGARQLFRIAGRKVGLADFRPMKRGPFGQFTVVKWEPKEVSIEDDVDEVATRWSGDLEKVLATILEEAAG